MNYSLIINTNQIKTLLKPAIFAAVTSLAIAGLFSILLVTARSPLIQELLQGYDLFKPALVVHVNLSVLIWLLTICIMFWSIITDEKFNYCNKISIYLVLCSIAFIAISPFVSKDSTALINNYIPVIDNLCFLLGLSFICCAVLLQSSLALLSYKSDQNIISYGIYISAVIAIIALICFVLSSLSLSSIINSIKRLEDYYELLFWGGGHVLQFLYVQIMQVCWILLLVNKKILPLGLLKFLFIFNLIVVLPSPIVYTVADIDTGLYQLYFTKQMQYGGGVAPTILAALVLYNLFSDKFICFNNYLAASLICSIGLFMIGGIISLLIRGNDVTIPAHYHGSTVGISLAFMGVVYWLIDKFELGQLNQKLSKIQPYLYATGQFLHIIGLAWSGGYGALRKSPEMILRPEIKISMALMGLGGMLAIIGGLLFVYICFRALLK